MTSATTLSPTHRSSAVLLQAKCAPDTPLEPHIFFTLRCTFLPYCAPGLNLQSNLYLSDLTSRVWPKKGKSDFFERSPLNVIDDTDLAKLTYR